MVMTTNKAIVKMAAVAVLAELRFRDGHRENICVKVENNLTSLISGVHEMNANASRLLSELVEREKTRGDCAEGEEDDQDSDEEDEDSDEEDEDSDEEDEDSDEDNKPQNSDFQPPTKRSKT